MIAEKGVDSLINDIKFDIKFDQQWWFVVETCRRTKLGFLFMISKPPTGTRGDRPINVTSINQIVEVSNL